MDTTPHAAAHLSLRRYLGLGRGHITEMGPRLTVGDYFQWLAQIDKRLSGKKTPVALLDRYARALPGLPAQPEPRNILLDLEEARELYVTLAQDGMIPNRPLEIEDACSDCKAMKPGEPRSFVVHGHGRDFKGVVTFDEQARRYVIDSTDLAESFHQVGDRPGPDLVTFLNRQQAFSILPDSTDVLYADGTFFSPSIATGKDFDSDRFQIGKVLDPHVGLEDLRSEKGTKTLRGGSGWEPDSVFGWLDGGLDRLLDNPKLVICDDMGTESADFLALDRDDNRIVLIHCKARKKRSLYSASALQEICGQAVKNCGTLNLFRPLKPPNIKRWHEPWSSNAVAGTVKSRIRRGLVGRKTSDFGEHLWLTFDARIRDPNAEREVWLVLGATLSKKELESELRKAAPAPEAIQATHLLQSTLASIGGGKCEVANSL